PSEALGFADYRRDGPALQYAAHLREDAEGARTRAALRDLHVCVVLRRQHDARRVGVVYRPGRVFVDRPGPPVLKDLVYLQQVPRPPEGVYLGQLVLQHLGVSLDEASRDDELLAAAAHLPFGEVEDR